MKKLLQMKALRAFLALVLSVITVTAAYALATDPNRLYFPRAYSNYQPWYYRLTVNWNDANIGSGVPFGGLAQGDFIKALDCHVTTAFNAGTTNQVTFGYTKANANELLGSTAGLVTTTTGVYHLTTAAGLGVQLTSQGTQTLYAKYAQTGTAATAGAVTCVIEVVSNNDM